MRLIDADDLQFITDWQWECVPKEDIEDAPTIDAVVIPKGATNGDMIKAMFPNVDINYGLKGIVGVKFIHMTIFDSDWWNSPYRKE